jgi:multidrug efflux pump subunit AcrA (membrane-fusion protein)
MAGKAHGTPPAAYTGDSLEVPVAAVFTTEDDDKSYVWTIDEGSETVARREVTVGELTDRGIRINSGLESGEWIATAGVHYLAEGQKVKLLRD